MKLTTALPNASQAFSKMTVEMQEEVGPILLRWMWKCADATSHFSKWGGWKTKASRRSRHERDMEARAQRALILTIQVLLKILQRKPQLLELELEVPFDSKTALGAVDQETDDVSILHLCDGN